jgi:hypothetical protein
MLAAAALGLALAAGCGSPGGGAPADADPVPRVEQLARADYADHYAGLRRDGDGVIVYRKPGSDLDRTVRDRVGGDLTFVDAKLSEREMLALVDRVVDDTDRWAAEGIRVTGAGPEADGSAVRVMTADGAPGEAGRLTAFYRMPIVVERGQAALAPLPITPSTARIRR